MTSSIEILAADCEMSGGMFQTKNNYYGPIYSTLLITRELRGDTQVNLKKFEPQTIIRLKRQLRTRHERLRI